MNYKLIINESSPRIIGVKNGIYQVEIDKNKFNNPDTYDKIMNFFSGVNYWSNAIRIPQFKVDIEAATPVKGCIFTDFLSFSPFLMGCPFMASHRLKNKIDQFNIGEHYWYPVSITGKENSLAPYQLLYLPFLEEEVIDFKNTVFGNQPILTRPKELFRFNSFEEYKENKDRMTFLSLEKLKLNSNFDSNVHLFTHRFSPGIFISEILWAEILKNEFTGAKILDTGPTANS